MFSVCHKEKSPSKTSCFLGNCCSWVSTQIMAVGLVGPLVESEKGNSYIMVVRDYFSQWMEAFPIPNLEATTVAEKLVEEIFLRFSVLEQLHFDQGRQFESKLITEICQLLNIHKTRTTPYHLQSDGLVEWFNRTCLTCYQLVPRIIRLIGSSTSVRCVWYTTAVSNPQLVMRRFI